MKKIIKYFSIVVISAFFMFVCNSKPASAIYDAEKNSVVISVSKEQIVVTVRYQRGFDGASSAKYYWCRIEKDNLSPETIEGCVASSDYKQFNEVDYVNAAGKSTVDFISKGDANNADNNITIQQFTVTKDNDFILKNLADLTNGSQDSTKYVIFVKASFCAVREFDTEGNVTGCRYWDDPKYIKLDNVDLMDLKNDQRVEIGDIADPGLSNMMQKISDIVYDIVLPIIWVIIGMVLVIKGSILGVQIVKAADEPQVRQEKINSLKWLVIGVAIAGLATGAVQVLTGFFSGAFKF